MFKSYKYRLYPTKAQEQQFAQHFGCARFVYNWGLAMKKKAWEEEKKRLSHFDITKELTQLKKQEETKWLQEVSILPLRGALKALDSAYEGFFKGKGYPKFKSKKDNYKSASYNDVKSVSIRWELNQILIPKIGLVKLVLDRTFAGKIKGCTVSKTPSGKYFVSVLVDDGLGIPPKALIIEETTIGIDVGIKDFATLSNGEKIENPRYLKKSLKKLKREQKRLNRKVSGSNNRNKQRIKVARLHEKVANQRKDFLQKVSTTLIRENQTICVEDLNVSGMMKNHKLAQAISDVSWSEFNRMLAYKAEWNGVNLIKIGRFEPSSKMCSCGVKNTELQLKDRMWTCESCGTTHDRDVLASQNIKKFGLEQVKQ